MPDISTLDKQRIGGLCEDCSGVLDAIVWNDEAPADGRYQRDEFTKIAEFPNEIFEKIVDGYMMLQFFRDLETRPESADKITEQLAKEDSGRKLCGDIALQQTTFMQKKIYPVIDRLLGSGTDEKIALALSMIAKLFKPEEYMRHRITETAARDIAAAQEVKQRLEPLVDEARFDIYFPSSTPKQQRDGTIDMVLGFGDELKFVELKSESNFTILDPAKKPQRWEQKVNKFYDPVSLKMRAITWELEIKIDGIVRNRLLCHAIIDGESIHYVKGHGDQIETNSMALTKGTRLSLESFTGIKEKVFHGKAKTGDSISFDILSVGIEGPKLKRETQRINKIDENGIEIETITAFEGEEESSISILDSRGSLLSYDDGGVQFYREGVAAKPRDAIRDRIKPSYAIGTGSLVEKSPGMLRMSLTGIDKPLFESPHYTWKKLGPNEWNLISRSISTTKSGQLEKPSKDFLKASASIQSDAPEIMKIAETIAGNADTDKEKVKKAIDWMKVNMHFEYDVIRQTSLDILHRKRGDCTEFSILFVTIARAMGVPARGIAGLAFSDQSETFVPHQWAEVFIDGGWEMVDPAWGQFPADATHIAIARNDTPSWTEIEPRVRNLEIEVEAIKE